MEIWVRNCSTCWPNFSFSPLKVCFGNRNIAGKWVEISLFYHIIFLLLHRFAVRISLPFIYFALINDGVARNCEVRHHSRVCHCRLADVATELERHLKTGKRAERTKLDFRCPFCLPLYHLSSELFDLRAPSSTDAPALLLNQAINMFTL